ncbi:MAG: rhodanese-like domain-containing protein [Clostridia bacterium]|nr:rhodanese-like domain-containing protein [Clostridia bacterium]
MMNLYMKLVKLIKKQRGTDEFCIDYETAKNMLNKEKDSILIDVRSPQEYREKHLYGSVNIPLFDFERGNYKIENKNKLIILYCEYGKRSKKVFNMLKKAGYTKVYQIDGGLDNI